MALFDTVCLSLDFINFIYNLFVTLSARGTYPLPSMLMKAVSVW